MGAGIYSSVQASDQPFLSGLCESVRFKQVFDFICFSFYPLTADCRAADLCMPLKRGSCSFAAGDGEAAEGGQRSLG